MLYIVKYIKKEIDITEIAFFKHIVNYILDHNYVFEIDHDMSNIILNIHNSSLYEALNMYLASVKLNINYNIEFNKGKSVNVPADKVKTLFEYIEYNVTYYRKKLTDDNTITISFIYKDEYNNTLNIINK